MVDGDRRRARDPAPSDFGRRAIKSSVLPRRASGGRSEFSRKPEKHELDFCASTASAQRSCGALIELLVCATASHENQYGPYEMPLQNKAAMPFLEAG